MAMADCVTREAFMTSIRSPAKARTAPAKCVNPFTGSRTNFFIKNTSETNDKNRMK
jgi:hypothetical protein